MFVLVVPIWRPINIMWYDLIQVIPRVTFTFQAFHMDVTDEQSVEEGAQYVRHKIPAGGGKIIITLEAKGFILCANDW